MDILFYVVLALSFPIFYIMGLITFVRALQKRPTPAIKVVDDSSTAVAKLHQYAASASPEVASALNKIANELGLAPSLAVAPGLIMPGDKHENRAVHAQVMPIASSHSASGRVLTADIGPVMHSLDNINLILYLGAFLIVVSAGIFIGFNFETLSGAFKTIFLGLLAATFYGVGLLLYLEFRKLRPAGVTFTAIGLVMLPSVGLAAYSLTSLHDSGSLVWLVTSIVTLLAYVFTLVLTRQTYITYLMAFTTLSLFEASVSMFDLPLYWFGWVMVSVAILLLMLSKSRLFWKDAASGLMISANIFVPLALVLSVISYTDDGLSQLGITIGLAGAFYAAMVRRFRGTPPADTYWGLAIASLPTALGIGLWDTLPRWEIALTMFVVGLVYLAVEYSFAEKLPHRWRENLGLVSGLLPVAGAAVLYDHPRSVLILMLGATVINVIFAHRLRQSALGLLAIISFITLPFIFARDFLTPTLSWGWVAALLLAEVPLLVVWAQHMADWPESGRTIGIFGYNSAIVLAILIAAFDSQTALLAVSLAAAAIWYGISYSENEPNYVYTGSAALYLALIQIPDIASWDRAFLSLILLGVGAALYAAGALDGHQARAKAFRYSGIVGPFLGAATGLFLPEPNLLPVYSLAVGGVLFWMEADRQSHSEAKEVAVAILILSLNWFCGVGEINQLQSYTIPWAIYFATLAYRRRSLGHVVYDNFLAVALAFLTIPLVGQALASDGPLYGMALIFEAIMLVFIGIAMSNRLVRTWGIVTLVISVLYQMKDAFLALTATLGVGLIIVAIVMLQRRKGD